MDSSATLRLMNVAETSASTAEESKSESRISELLTDEELISQVCRGSKEAMAMVFRRYYRVLHAISRKILRNQAEADDFVQDIFLGLHKQAGSFDATKGRVRTWILQMVYRRAISRRRYLTVRHFYTRIDLDDVATEVSDDRAISRAVANAVDDEFGNGTLKKVFDEMSDNQRETLCLFFIEGYTFGEIAIKLGQSRGNIKHHYFRGLEQF